jgi:nucleoside-diphosphate-sugar epimerase
MKHIILGAGGAIATPLTDTLLREQQNVKLLSRSAKPVAGAESMSVNVLDAASVLAAIEPDSVVHLLVGLEYSTKVWQETWMNCIKNTVEACQHHGARLIFFDNVYMYGRVIGAMTEATPINPCSKKGEVRAKVAEYMMNAYSKGTIQGMIARSADFYGPYAQQTSVLQLLAFDNLAKGKKAQFLISPNTKHSYSYTLDCAEAMYLLAKDESAWNQVWHLPTKNPALTGIELTALAAKALGVEARTSSMGKTMMSIGGLFVPIVKEIQEMTYQNEQDYFFDSTKFEKHFNFTPTSYEQGVVGALKHFYPDRVR